MRSFLRHKYFHAFLFLAPTLILLLVFFIIPVIQGFFYSLTDWDGVSRSYNFIGLRNFELVLTQRQSVAIFRNTFYLAIIYIPVLNVVAMAMAVFIKACGKLQNLYKSIVFLPHLLAMAVVGYIWKMLLNPSFGAVNKFLESIGLQFMAIDWLGTVNTVLPAISMATVWFSAGFYMVIYFSGLMGISQEYYEAAAIDGASPWQQFWFITLPLLSASITVNVILSTLGILGAFDLPYVMTLGGPGYSSTTIALQIFFYNSRSVNIPFGVATAALLCIISVIITAILFKITNRREV